MPNYNDQVHHLVVNGFKGLGADEPDRITCRVLVKDEFFVGQLFLCGNLRAVLMTDDVEVRFYDPQGTLLKTVTLEDQPQVKKAA